MQPGYELDSKVASVLELEQLTLGRIPPGICTDMMGNGPEWFEPSKNWNHAMWAANRCDLFKSTILEQDDDGRWQVSRLLHKLDGPVVQFVSDDWSGPVAICLAILKVTEAPA